MSKSAKHFSQVFSIPAVAVCLLLTGCEEPQETTDFIRPVRTMTVQDVENFVQRFFPGRAAATQEINASFRVSGQLIKRPISVGMEITKGDLVAALDPSTFQAEVDRLQAEVASSKASLERAELEFDRQEKLLAGGWVTRSRVETERSIALAARASRLAAEAALERAQLDLSYTTLTAPFDGVVVETYVENFQEVVATQPIARIVDTSQVEFWISVPENLISMTPYVRDVTVEFDAFPGRPLPAQINEVKSEASETTRTFDVNLIMDQPEDFTVLPGMAGKATAARIELPEDQQVQGYEVPLTAIFNPEGDKEFVWVVGSDPTNVSMREINSIEATARGVLVQGIAAGECIVTAGVEYLRDGQEVRADQC